MGVKGNGFKCQSGQVLMCPLGCASEAIKSQKNVLKDASITYKHPTKEVPMKYICGWSRTKKSKWCEK